MQHTRRDCGLLRTHLSRSCQYGTLPHCVCASAYIRCPTAMEPAEAAGAHPAAGVVLFDATSTPMQAMTTDSTPPHFNLPVANGAIDGRSARRTARRFSFATMVRPVSGLVAFLLVAGCANISVSTPPPPDPPGRFVALTRPVIVLGDTQEHESTGFPLHDNDGAIDEYVEVAQRPPEQPLFGRRILEWALLSNPGRTGHSHGRPARRILRIGAGPDAQSVRGRQAAACDPSGQP